jgi:hypothetical protein
MFELCSIPGAFPGVEREDTSIHPLARTNLALGAALCTRLGRLHAWGEWRSWGNAPLALVAGRAMRMAWNLRRSGRVDGA